LRADHFAVVDFQIASLSLWAVSIRPLIVTS